MALSPQNQGPSNIPFVHFGVPGQGDSRRSGVISKDTVQSEESDTTTTTTIYNAIRASNTTDDDVQMYSATMLDGQLAANMAMFMPLAPTLTLHQPSGRRVEQQPDSTLWRSHSQLGGRKALSLNDTDNCSRAPLWPDSLMSPAKPVAPEYPPPTRSPTPPGLPSFGTQEAVCYSAQFLVQCSSTNSRSQRRAHGDNNSRHTSYGQSLRRFLGFSSTTTAGPSNGPSSVRGIGRAENGTAVLGRFPYRQSGHGMNATRQLENHRFHQTSLPVAECESISPHDDVSIRRRQSGSSNAAAKEEYSSPVFPRPSSQRRSDRLSRMQTLHSSRTVPPSTSGLTTSTTGPETPAPTIPHCALSRAQPHQSHFSQTQHIQTARENHDLPHPRSPDPVISAGAYGNHYPPAQQSALNNNNNNNNNNSINNNDDGDNYNNNNNNNNTTMTIPSADLVLEESPDVSEPRRNSWVESLKTAYSYFFCCLDDEPDDDSPMVELRSSSDTYATARSWNNIEDNNNSEHERETSHVVVPGTDCQNVPL